MPFIFLFSLILCNIPLLAQDSLRDELRSIVEQSYRAGSESLKSASERAIFLASDILRSEGTEFSKISIPGNKINYSAVEILPKYSRGEIGKKIEIWKKHLNDLPIVYAPEVLMGNGTSAFFDPNGAFLGLAHDLLLNAESISSPTVHETYHAYTYKQLLAGEEDLYAGYYRVIKDGHLSQMNQEYYDRFGSIDEIVATSLSVLIDNEKLQSEKTRLSIDDREDILGEIYFSLRILKFLSKQLSDVATRIKSSSHFKTQKVKLRLGKTEKEITQLIFTLDSFTREVVPGGGRTHMVARPGGAEWIMYQTNDTKASNLPKRLEKLSEAAHKIGPLVDQAMKCIYVMIEFPRLDRTDLKCLNEKSPMIYHTLEAFKIKQYPLSLFKL